MATTKESPTEERLERASRVPKSKTRHVLVSRARVPKSERKLKPLNVLIVEAGIAQSIDEARAMLIAGEICHETKGPQYNVKGYPLWVHGEPIPSLGATSNVGNILLYEDAMIVHRRKCPECRKPIIFAKRDKKAAISSMTHSAVEEGGDFRYETLSSDSTLIRQEDLEAYIYRQRQIKEVGEPIAVALSKGAAVEDGVHTAELLPVHNEDGSVNLKLVIR